MSFGIKLYPPAIAGAFSPRNGGVLTDSDSAPVQTGIGTEWVLLDVWDIAQDGPGVTADIAAPAVLTTGDLSYADSDPDTITRASGSWIDDGVRAGSQLVIVGGTNAGTYTVASATALIATLVASDTLIAGGPESVTSVTMQNKSMLVSTAGKYSCGLGMSCEGSTNTTFDVAVRVNGLEIDDKIGFQRKIGTGGDVGSSARQGFIDLEAGDVVQAWIKADGASKEVTSIYAHLTLQRSS